MSLEILRIHTLMERLNSKNPYRNRGASLPERPRASQEGLPLDRTAASSSQLDSVQQLLNRLEYNFLPHTFFCLEKHRAFHRLVGTAKEILQESLPIRCLEATFVALYLTCSLKDVERFPIAFKSRAGGKSFRHIVLALKHKGFYGAVGLSRSEHLMDKPLSFRSLSDLIQEYMQCYRKVGHQLVSFKLGLFVTHDASSRAVPCWRFLSLPLSPGLNVIQDCLRTSMILEHFELLLPAVSEQYMKLATARADGGLSLASPQSPASVNAASPASTSSCPPSRQQMQGSMPLPKTPPYSAMLINDDDDASDSEENQRRISCIVGMTSPFAESSDTIEGKFTSRLRRAVHENPYNVNSVDSSRGSVGTAPQHSVRSRTVPVGLARKGSTTSINNSSPTKKNSSDDEFSSSQLMMSDSTTTTPKIASEDLRKAPKPASTPSAGSSQRRSSSQHPR